MGIVDPLLFVRSRETHEAVSLQHEQGKEGRVDVGQEVRFGDECKLNNITFFSWTAATHPSFSSTSVAEILNGRHVHDIGVASVFEHVKGLKCDIRCETLVDMQMKERMECFHRFPNGAHLTLLSSPIRLSRGESGKKVAFCFEFERVFLFFFSPPSKK